MRPREARKANMSQNYPSQMLMPTNGSSGELYIRVTMSNIHGQNHDVTDTIHHFYSTYGNDKEILDHYANKLN